ncbi:MAG: pyridoxamine 5'-phosphate oxidase family protein [Thermocrispum sp.]
MILGQDEMRRRVAAVRVARMATVDEHGRAHIVPVLFAVDGDILYSPTDKPTAVKPRPKRLCNLDRDPRITILADFYHEDWLKAWWIRMRGTAREIADGPERTHATSLIDGKYKQFLGDVYLTDGGPVLAVDISDWRGWAYGDGPTRKWWPLRGLPWRRAA